MIPISSPGRAVEAQRHDIESSISRVLSSGWLILGPENEALTIEMSEYLGCSEVILVGNGTDALEIALLSIGVRPSQLVVTVANAGGYACTAITKIGAVPLFVDVSSTDLEMATEGEFGLRAVLQAAPTRPAAIVVTHLFGNAAPIEEVIHLASEFGIPVVEDCAQSFGAELNGKRLGTFGKVSTTSFYPTKNLGALGDGGAIFTSDSETAERAKMLRQYGWSERYHSRLGGGRNSRLDEIQAAILRLRLKKIDEANERRRSIHRRYVAASHSGEVISFTHSSSPSFVGHLAICTTDYRNHLRDFLREKKIATDIHYPAPDHKQPPWSHYSSGPLPETERQISRILTLPLFPEIAESEVEIIEAALSTFGDGGRNF